MPSLCAEVGEGLAYGLRASGDSGLWAEVGEGLAYGLRASGCSGLWAEVGEGLAYGLRAFSLLFTFDSKCFFMFAFDALHHIYGNTQKKIFQKKLIVACINQILYVPLQHLNNTHKKNNISPRHHGKVNSNDKKV